VVSTPSSRTTTQTAPWSCWFSERTRRSRPRAARRSTEPVDAERMAQNCAVRIGISREAPALHLGLRAPFPAAALDPCSPATRRVPSAIAPVAREAPGMNQIGPIERKRDWLHQSVRLRQRGVPGRLEVHHIVPTRFDREKFFELENLELVCRAHHGMREREAKSGSFIVAILGSPAFRPWRHDGCHLVRAYQVRPRRTGV
jgi:hypothetical protein